MVMMPAVASSAEKPRVGVSLARRTPMARVTVESSKTGVGESPMDNGQARQLDGGISRQADMADSSSQ